MQKWSWILYRVWRLYRWSIKLSPSRSFLQSSGRGRPRQSEWWLKTPKSPRLRKYSISVSKGHLVGSSISSFPWIVSAEPSIIAFSLCSSERMRMSPIWSSSPIWARPVLLLCAPRSFQSFAKGFYIFNASPWTLELCRTQCLIY